MMSPAVKRSIEEFLESEQVAPEEVVRIMTEHRAQLRSVFDRASDKYESQLPSSPVELAENLGFSEATMLKEQRHALAAALESVMNTLPVDATLKDDIMHKLASNITRLEELGQPIEVITIKIHP